MSVTGWISQAVARQLSRLFGAVFSASSKCSKSNSIQPLNAQHYEITPTARFRGHHLAAQEMSTLDSDFHTRVVGPTQPTQQHSWRGF
jgi:hypothetical protein